MPIVAPVEPGTIAKVIIEATGGQPTIGQLTVGQPSIGQPLTVDVLKARKQEIAAPKADRNKHRQSVMLGDSRLEVVA